MANRKKLPAGKSSKAESSFLHTLGSARTGFGLSNVYPEKERESEQMRRRRFAELSYVSSLIDLAYVVCEKEGTTPENKLTEILSNRSKQHVSPTKGAPTASKNRSGLNALVNNPVIFLEEYIKTSRNGLARSGIAAFLWFYCVKAENVLKRKTGNHAFGFYLGRVINGLLQAIQYPANRKNIIETLINDIKPDVERGRKVRNGASLGGKARADSFKNQKDIWKDTNNRLRKEKPHLKKIERARKIAKIHGGNVETIRRRID